MYFLYLTMLICRLNTFILFFLTVLFFSFSAYYNEKKIIQLDLTKFEHDKELQNYYSEHMCK